MIHIQRLDPSYKMGRWITVSNDSTKKPADATIIWFALGWKPKKKAKR